MNQSHACSAAKPKNPQSRIHLRRLQKLQKLGLFTNNETGATITRAVTVDDLSAAYELVHSSFVSCGYTRAVPSGLRVRPFETSKDTATFIAKIDGRVVGVLSLVVDTWDLGLPSESVFGTEIGEVRRQTERIGELTSLAILPEFRNTAVTSELMRCLYAQSVYAGCSDLICAVSRWLVPIFGSMGFEQVGPEKNYSQSDGAPDPVRLLRLDNVPTRWHRLPPGADAVNDFWFQFHVAQNPHGAQVDDWQARSESLFDSPYEIAPLFAKCRELFTESNTSELTAIKRRLGMAFELAVPIDVLRSYHRATESIRLRLNRTGRAVAQQPNRAQADCYKTMKLWPPKLRQSASLRNTRKLTKSLTRSGMSSAPLGVEDLADLPG